MLFLCLATAIQITEVYVRSMDSKPGQQWVELFNSSKEPVNLSGARVRRVDGVKKKKEAWRLTLPSTDLRLEPGSYALIAEQADLGLGICSDDLVIAVGRRPFSLKSSGAQEICIRPEGFKETCARFSDSHAIEGNFSRNLFETIWLNEICEFLPGIYASPGMPAYFCEQSIKSTWRICPQILQEAPKRPHLGCSAILGSQTSPIGLILFFLFLCPLLLSRKHFF